MTFQINQIHLLVQLAGLSRHSSFERGSYTRNHHIDILLPNDKNCIKGVIYQNLCKKFKDQLEEVNIFTLSKAKIKNYKGPGHNLPLKDIQIEFAINTEVNQLAISVSMYRKK